MWWSLDCCSFRKAVGVLVQKANYLLLKNVLWLSCPYNFVVFLQIKKKNLLYTYLFILGLQSSFVTSPLLPPSVGRSWMLQRTVLYNDLALYILFWVQGGRLMHPHVSNGCHSIHKMIFTGLKRRKCGAVVEHEEDDLKKSKYSWG